ncbi:hypothetical protein MLD38_021764 [Melastoma candidum]|uniref:Uncharacterized protein n=1 Tax=Melastoma candidum TaxID=119954 RepID=A0ACB9QKZ5_9MYRT|nr:hypothetical protein MLD38_021764 [Melastoma candidum]
MVLLRRLVGGSLDASLGELRRCHLSLRRITAQSFRGDAEVGRYDVVRTLCGGLRRGWNWDSLSRKFDGLGLDNDLVEKVLLELKEPDDARCALSFFHWSAKEKRFEHGIRSYCVMINILVRGRMIRDAKALLESVLKKTGENSSSFLVVDSLLESYGVTDVDPLVFNLLVQAYAKLRMFDVGLEVCSYLGKRGFSLSLATFNALLHVVQRSDRCEFVWKIYEHMIKERVYPSEATVEILISALGKEGKLQVFVDMLDRIQGKRCSPSVIVNTCLIFRIIEEGNGEEVLTLLRRLLQKNLVPDTVAYSLITFSKLKTGDIESATILNAEMISRGFDPNAFLYTKFIRAHCQGGGFEEANRLMLEMQKLGLRPYDGTYESIIEASAEAGRIEDCLLNFHGMLDAGLVPACPIFNVMAGKLCELGKVTEANELLTLLIDKGFSPDETTYSLLISGFGQVAEAEEGIKLYNEARFRKLPCGSSSIIRAALIESLRRCGKFMEAEKYHGIMEDYLEILRDDWFSRSPVAYLHKCLGRTSSSSVSTSKASPPATQSTRMTSVFQGSTSSRISSKEAAPPVIPLLGSPGLRFLGVNSKSIDCKMLGGGFVSSRSSDRIGGRMFSLRRSLVHKRRPLAITNSSPSNSGSTSEESSDKEKTPFGYTRKDVLLIGLGVTVLGVGLKSGLEFAGVDPLQAGNVVQLVLVLGLTVGWISTYIFRVSNKEMTYAQQLRDYEYKVMEKRIESLTEAELQALLEQVEEEKKTLGQ